MASAHVSEENLRHPQDRLVFIASVVLNLALMAAAVYLVANAPDWLTSHPVLRKPLEHIRTLAIIAIFALPAAVIIRNERRVSIRGNSIRLSRDQFASLYDRLQSHCTKLGLTTAPELYITNSAIREPAQAFSSWKRDYIVMNQSVVDPALESGGDVMAFILGRELGRIRLGYTRLWTEILLTYVLRIPYLNIPITRVRTYSCDRYGAFLAPDGVRGLIISVSGRRLLQSVNVEDYLKQSALHEGLWSRIGSTVTEKPPVLYRLKALYDAGLLDWSQDLTRFHEKTSA
ncbi:MAG TPA: hypothetical protein VKJ45_10650, partial [Blastocatellia bacterium]|nr:hypothetical protein [Blastocatellia bacterium]